MALKDKDEPLGAGLPRAPQCLGPLSSVFMQEKGRGWRMEAWTGSVNYGVPTTTPLSSPLTRPLSPIHTLVKLAIFQIDF